MIAEGWHERAGGAHAEALALKAAGAAARGATAYITLEPCIHQGHTQPCADALIAAGVQRVCYAIRDPDPRVSGGGATRLAAAGVELTTGVRAAAARALNPGFISRMERGRPWVRLKLAASMDGRTALQNGQSRWITGDAARADVQRLRARSSAVMTGSATVRFDDPRLDVRMPEVIRQPLRVVLDTRLRTPPSARIVAPPGRLLLLTASADEARKTTLEAVGASVERISAGPGGLDLSAVMRRLAALEVNELQVESGSTLAGALLTARFVDELVLYLAPTLLGSDARPLAQLPSIVSMADRMDLSIADLRRVGTDLRITLRPAQG